MSVQIAQRPFTVTEYYRMAEAGILSEDDRLELIEGRIITMAPIGSRHAACVKRLTSLFSNQIGDVAILSVQDPIQLDEYSEPLPDLALLRPRDDFYAQRHPIPADVLLLVEVSDTSLEYDRDVKVPSYVGAGIPEVWLVNLPENLIEVYTRPVSGVYQDISQLRPGEVIAVSSIPEIRIDVNSILG